MIPPDNLQKTPLGKADFSWFTDGSYFKNENGKYCAGYTIVTSFDIIEAATLPLATSAQQAELYSLTWARILAKGKTVNIYTDSTYAFGLVYDFGMLWKQCSFLTANEDKIENGSYAQKLFDAIIWEAFATFKIPGHSKLDPPRR